MKVAPGAQLLDRGGRRCASRRRWPGRRGQRRGGRRPARDSRPGRGRRSRGTGPGPGHPRMLPRHWASRASASPSTPRTRQERPRCPTARPRAAAAGPRYATPPAYARRWHGAGRKCATSGWPSAGPAASCDRPMGFDSWPWPGRAVSRGGGELNANPAVASTVSAFGPLSPKLLHRAASAGTSGVRMQAGPYPWFTREAPHRSDAGCRP